MILLLNAHLHRQWAVQRNQCPADTCQLPIDTTAESGAMSLI